MQPRDATFVRLKSLPLRWLIRASSFTIFVPYVCYKRTEQILSSQFKYPPSADKCGLLICNHTLFSLSCFSLGCIVFSLSPVLVLPPASCFSPVPFLTYVTFLLKSLHLSHPGPQALARDFRRFFLISEKRHFDFCFFFYSSRENE